MTIGDPASIPPIPYPVSERFADWWHGWRDGVRDVPQRRRGRITTPHRDVLIRSAQEAFEYERVAFEVARLRTGREIADARARLVGAETRLAAAERELAHFEAIPEWQDWTRRRFREDDRPASVVTQRRLREYERARRPYVQAVQSLRHDRDSCSGELAAAKRTRTADREGAAARVRAIHEYWHRRLAIYRRSLVRSHREGPLLDGEIDRVAPVVPLWPSEPGAAPDLGEPLDAPPAPYPRIIVLGDITDFGCEPERDGYVHLDKAAYRHATLVRSGETYRLRDHGLGDGTFIGGAPIRGEAELDVGDQFVIGDCRLRIFPDQLLKIVPLGPPSLVVAELSHKFEKDRPWWLPAWWRRGRDADKQRKSRLERMSFSQNEGTVMAIIGPSGAGKSSLFSAILGELPTRDGGSLFFGDRDGDLDLRRGAAQIRSRLGFVPQDDSMHRTLRVSALLHYSDRIRSPYQGGREERIARVCRDLDLRPKQLAGRADELSGGQRKRVSIALEILADPQLLLLDEPTSGLDAGMDREVMLKLQKMASGDGTGSRRTVVVVTHSSDNLHLADLVLVLAPGGRPVYLGKSRKIPQQFLGKNATYADLMKTLTDDKLPKDRESVQTGSDVQTDPGQKSIVELWTGRYATGPHAERAREDARAAADRLGNAPARLARAPRAVRRSFNQFGVLFQRQWSLIAARARVRPREDGRVKAALGAAVVAMPLLLAVFGAGVAALVTSTDALSTGPLALPTALNLLVTLMMLAGQSLTYSDIVGEFDVIKREHRTGASVLAVVMAKWVVFATLAVVQAGVVAALYQWWRGGPKDSLVLSPGWELFVDLSLLAVGAMSLGILVSVLAKKLEQAVAMATGIAILQVALNGWTADLSAELYLQVASAPLPARWGFALLASSVDLRARVPTAAPDALWEHAADQWWANAAWSAGLTFLYVALAVVLLHRRLAAPR